MEALSESKKIKLAKFKFRYPERYQKELDLIGVTENELEKYIQNEKKRINSIAKTTNESIKQGHVYYMGGRPYWSDEPEKPRVVPINSSNNSSKKVAKDEKKKSLILIDGDNHPYEAIKGIENYLGKADVRVRVYATDEHLLNKMKEELDEKGIKHVRTVLVEQGNQAVDNRIKFVLEQEAKSHTHSKISIISHDQGYREKIKECKQKYKWVNNKIILCKYMKDALN